MKRLRVLLMLLLLPARAGLVSAQSPQPASPTDDEAVVTWIRQNAIPLHSVRAGSGFTDLRPLKTLLKDVRIVGLGEATHGTSEFQQVKHRLLEFLVTQMGFTAFAMEAAYSDAQPINDYVLYGKGDRASVLTGLGYVAWDTEEFAAMLDWLRAYNRTVPEPRRVRFYGLDMYRNQVGRKKVLAFVRKVAPEVEATTDSLFLVLADQEARWPLWDTTVMASARPRLDALSSDLAARKGSLRGRVPAPEYDEALHLIDVMRQGASLKDRSRYLAENLMYLVDHERPGTKFVVWAHDYHVATDAPQRGGYYLRKQYGDGYYAVALAFDHGSYQARSFPPPGDFKLGTVSPAPAGSLEWYLARAGIPRFFLDLRATPRIPLVENWLRTPRNVRSVNWAYQDPSTLFVPMNVRERYDGFLFVTESTPTHPTANARSTVARKASF